MIQTAANTPWRHNLRKCDIYGTCNILGGNDQCDRSVTQHIYHHYRHICCTFVFLHGLWYLHTFIHMYKYLYVHIMSRKMSKYTKHLGTHLLRFKLPWGMNVYSPNFYKLPTGGIHYRKWEQFLCQIWDNGHLSQYAWQYWGGTAINLCAIYDPLVQKRLTVI